MISRIKKTPEQLVRLVEEKLTANNIAFRAIPHAPEGNCEKVSELRGNPVHAAAKALLLNVKISNKNSVFVLTILPGDRKVDLKAIAAKFSAKSASMAERTKVEELLDCEIGRVPPFTFNNQVAVIVDESLVEDNDKIYFSPGRLDLSMEISAQEYKKVILKEGGKVFGFSEKSIYQTPITTFAAESSTPPAPAVAATIETPKPV